MQKPEPEVEVPAPDLDEDLGNLAGEPVDTNSSDLPTADANGNSDDERADENQAVPDKA